jgi:predicted nuclease of predicted toxin-antitoxin system
LARLLADENFPLPAVDELRRLGHDVLTIADVGRSGQAWADAEVLAFARDGGRALISLDRRDFMRLHRDGMPHAGLVLCTLDLDFLGQARRIHEAVAAAGELSGAVLRVNRPSR